MKPITYEAYRANPLIRVQLEREARSARSQAMGRAFAMLFSSLVRRLQRKPSAVFVIRTA